MNKYDEILRKEAFKSLPQETLTAFKELMVSIEGKSVNDSLMPIMKFYTSMPKTTVLSKNEQSALIQAVLEGLDRNEQEKFTKILAFFNL